VAKRKRKRPGRSCRSSRAADGKREEAGRPMPSPPLPLRPRDMMPGDVTLPPTILSAASLVLFLSGSCADVPARAIEAVDGVAHGPRVGSILQVRGPLAGNVGRTGRRRTDRAAFCRRPQAYSSMTFTPVPTEGCCCGDRSWGCRTSGRMS
jgi:hypothetical protein